MGNVVQIEEFKRRPRVVNGVLEIRALEVDTKTVSMRDLETHVSVQAEPWKEAILAGHLKVTFWTHFPGGSKVRYLVGKRGTLR